VLPLLDPRLRQVEDTANTDSEYPKTSGSTLTNEPELPGQPADDQNDPLKPRNEQLQHMPVSARVPTNVGRGVLSTGVVAFHGPSEFVLDFLLRLGSPHSVAARIVLSPQVLGQFLQALRENVTMYTNRFGAPPSLPVPPPQAKNIPINDLYDELKLPDEMLSGVYANAVMIGHSPSEFWFDFITNFFPRSAVSARVYMTAQQIPGLVDTLTTSFEAFQRRQGEGPGPM
jgi:hypothetical protein